jgi:excisionase family DNA binding protein
MAASTNPDKDIFTTHEVSKLLQVNPRSVINWIEQDLLKSYRTPGGHRRISRGDLLAFLRKHEIPIPSALTEEKLKVLIVEDEDSIVKILTTFFERQEAYEVNSASDGITALIDIGRSHPDLIVLDILIPGVDGLEVCRRIKENPSNRTAIIAMSGHPEVESKILQAGADCFLPKPLDLDRLLEESKRLLRIL